MKKILLCLAALIISSCAVQSQAPDTSGTKMTETYNGFWNKLSFVQTPLTPPSEWDKSKNVFWKTKVGTGYSTPVVWQEKVYVLGEPGTLYCLEKTTGNIFWSLSTTDNDVAPAEKGKLNVVSSGCGNAASTPAVSNDGVFIVLASGIVSRIGLDGKRMWIKVFDQPMNGSYGRSASPIILGEKLLVSLDHLIALDIKTGETLWECAGAANDYATPDILVLSGKKFILMPGGWIVNPEDGKKAANVDGSDYASPVVLGDTFYFAGSNAAAFKASLDEKGALKTEKLWETQIQGEQVSTPLVFDGLFYSITDDAMLLVIDAKTGEKKLEANIGEKINPPFFAALKAAGGNIYISNDSGSVAVMAPGIEQKILAVNNIEGRSGATPVFEGTKLFLRVGEEIYCIGK